VAVVLEPTARNAAWNEEKIELWAMNGFFNEPAAGMTGG
jgi:hypothetical protein